MSSKLKLLSYSVRSFDKTLSVRSYKIYMDLMEGYLLDYPLEIRNKVLGLLRAKDFITLLEWTDSFLTKGTAEACTAAQFRAVNQLAALIKKYPFPADNLRNLARKSAYEKFVAAENRCKRYNLKFRRINFGSKELDSDIFNRMAGWIRGLIGDEPNLQRIFRGCSFGPGASIGVHGNSTNLARKLLAKEWTCTPSALPYAATALAEDHHMWELIQPQINGYFCFDRELFRKELNAKVRLVQNNKIAFVPKTTLVDRTIAVEPLLNGYLQKGVDLFMRSRLKRVGIDLSDQTTNQNLARLGSTETGDPFVTIDLSSASDSLSLEVVRRFLPPDWFNFLDSIRSPAYRLDDGVEIRYEKFVSMGNGFCFPLETLLFASVCRLYSKPKDFSVYGDDIIVRQSVASKVIKTLWSIGFRHNRSKTFLNGPFRESCGADWFAGLPVRPLTLDYKLDSIQSVVKFHNMSLRNDFWSNRFSEVRNYLRTLVPESLRFLRPYSGVEYGAFEVPLDMFQSSPFSHWDRNVQSWSWVEIELKGVSDKGTSRHERYPTALMMASLRGSPSSDPFAKRRETSQTVRRKTYAGASSTWLPPL